MADSGTGAAVEASQSDKSAPDQRRAALDARFKASEEKRRVDREARQQQNEEQCAPEENSARFWKSFNADIKALREDVQATVKAAASLGDAVKRRTMPAKVDAWTAKLSELEGRSSAATIFLAKYDVRQVQTAIAESREKVNDARQEILPRKKFTFSRKHKKKAAVEAAPESKGEAKGEEADSCSKFEVPEKSFEHRSGELLVVLPGELDDGSGTSVDFRLTYLTDCTVYILDVTRALHVDNLTNCKVYVGAIAGSVLLEKCEDCLFLFASRQIRLHSSHRCHFLLHVLSHPIIEHCDTLAFGQYTLRYKALRDQMQTAGLMKLEARYEWKQVDDFGWHKQQQSPNWRLLKAGEYPTSLAKSGDAKLVGLGLGLNQLAAHSESKAVKEADDSPAAVDAAVAEAEEESDDEL